MKILIVGGAGYIGSHMVKKLVLSGHDVMTLDNLSTGFRDAVAYGTFVEGDMGDSTCLGSIFSQQAIDVVMHFAAFSQVGESMTEPAKYYRNNVANTQNLLDEMLKHGIKRFIFSSTAAVYGEPQSAVINETHQLNPINPYGHSKKMVEQMLKDYDAAYGLKSVALRYFNASGADPDAMLGERHDPETHIIPLVLQAASGRRDDITVFGQDYDTPDGTCVRDYIHIQDLCDAHALAMQWLLDNRGSRVFNLGNGDGYSIRELIDAVKRVTGRDFAVTDGERRAGDPARLVADASLATSLLGWQPQFGDLDTIVAHAWAWEQQHGKSW